MGGPPLDARRPVLVAAGQCTWFLGKGRQACEGELASLVADLIDDEEDLEAELEAALEESGDQSAAAQKAPPPLPLRLQQPVVAPLQLAADGYVDEDALTREQRNRLDA